MPDGEVERVSILFVTKSRTVDRAQNLNVAYHNDYSA
jgi:hypothetical protein